MHGCRRRAFAILLAWSVAIGAGGLSAVAEEAGANRRLPNVAPAQYLPDAAAPGPANEIVKGHISAEKAEVLAWYRPGYWFPGGKLTGSIELGINGSRGNADSFSIRAGGKLKHDVDWRTFTMDLTHARTDSDGVETQNNAIFNARHDWKLGDSPWSIFAKLQLEYDEFKAFDLRVVMNAGWGYQFWKNDFHALKGRFGAGASREFGGPDESWTPEAVFGLDYECKISDRQKFTASADYLPSWEDFMDYRLNTTLAWEICLDAAHNLNLKVGVFDRYDSTPNGSKSNDIDYSVLLLWNL